jgi:hypothetical protein
MAGIKVTIVPGLLPNCQSHSGFGHNYTRIVTHILFLHGFRSQLHPASPAKNRERNSKVVK